MRGWYFHFRVGKSQNRRIFVAKSLLISVDWSVIRLGVFSSSQCNSVYLPLKSALFLWKKTGFVAPTSKPIVVLTPGAAPLDPPEAEIARPEVVAQTKSTGMTLRSQFRENRSKVTTVRADIHSESTGFATRPEPEVARPEIEIAPVARSSFGDIAVVSSRSQSVESGSEVGVESQSGYPCTSGPTRTGNHSILFPSPIPTTVFQLLYVPAAKSSIHCKRNRNRQVHVLIPQ